MEEGLKRVIDACNQSLANSKGDSMIILENTAGTKNSVGSKFEELKQIYDNVDDNTRLGFCFDTCHAFAAGYDLSTKNAVHNTINELDHILGLNNLKVVHLNDSKGGLGEHLDRHHHIGQGYIGEKGFREILKNQSITDLPMILETPIDENTGDLENIKKIQILYSHL